jgi:hypothetical protein
MIETDLEQIFDALNGHRVRYLVVGGLAVAAHGHPRFTADVELVVALDRENALRTIQALGGLGYRPLAPVSSDAFADASVRHGWIEEKGMMVFQLLSAQRPETPIDLFVQEPFDFEAEYAIAPRMELAAGRSVPVVSYATLIAMKASARRPKDLEDITNLGYVHQKPATPDMDA